jgi:outer membrane receptor protein involved in Fe transport
VASPTVSTPYPADYDTRIPAYFLLDLKAGVRWDKYDVSIFARNVTDEVAWEGASPGGGGTYVYSARPQSVGVEASAKF